MTGLLAGLLLPVVLGAWVGARGWFDAPRQLVRHLNRYAIGLAFPALVVRGLLDPTFVAPASAGVFVALPAAFVVCMALAHAAAWLVPRDVWPDARTQLGVTALTAAFGNVAYLGLPLCAALLGEQVTGLAALLVSEHVVLGLLVGPALALRATRRGGRADWGPLLRQPLLWAPWVGLALRGLPGGPQVRAALTPLAGSAAPVALFLLGLYLHTQWAEARAAARVSAHARPPEDAARPPTEPSTRPLLPTLVKLVALPAATLALCLGWNAAALGEGLLGPLAVETLVVATLLASMPAAIATFSLAEALDTAPTVVARTIVSTTLLAPVTVALWLYVLQRGWPEGFG